MGSLCSKACSNSASRSKLSRLNNTNKTETLNKSLAQQKNSTGLQLQKKLPHPEPQRIKSNAVSNPPPLPKQRGIIGRMVEDIASIAIGTSLGRAIGKWLVNRSSTNNDVDSNEDHNANKEVHDQPTGQDQEQMEQEDQELMEKDDTSDDQEDE